VNRNLLSLFEKTTVIKTVENERICSSTGTLVTIVFENVSFPELLGDVPPIYFDSLNGEVGGFKDLRTGLGNGNGIPLSDVSSSFVVPLSAVSQEVQKGRIQSNGYADYISVVGNGTEVIFEYVVRDGDSVPALDVVDMDFQLGTVFNPLTMAAISTSIPSPGASSRYAPPP
jgi:hypothetical protein